MAKSQVIYYSMAWYMMSIIDSATTKMFLVDYPYPVTVSLAHMTINLLLFYAISLWNGTNHKLLDFPILKYTAGLGFLKMIVSIFAHTSFLMLTLAYSQTIRTLSPLFIIILKKLFYEKSEPTYVYISIMLMSVGVTICTLTEYSVNVLGISASVMMICCSSLFSFTSKHYLTKFQVDSFSLALDIHLVAFLLVVPVWIFVELPYILSNPKLGNAENKMFFALMFLIQGIVSFGCHYLKFSLLPLISSVSYTMIESGKSIFKIIISMLMYNYYHSFFNVIGIMVAVIGAVLYHSMNAIVSLKSD